jgi:hypothetical protein
MVNGHLQQASATFFKAMAAVSENYRYLAVYFLLIYINILNFPVLFNPDLSLKISRCNYF